MNATTTLKDIEDNEVYQQVLKDSFGGVMYNVANYGKYDSAEVLAIWDGLDQRHRNAANGIIKGAIRFLQGN